MTNLDELLIPDEVLQLASPEELAAYEKALTREMALLSPLDYAVHVTEGRMKRYDHTELLSRHAKALCEHALYPSGIGPPAVFTPDPDDPDDGAWLHPETGEEAHNILVLSTPPQHGKAVKYTESVWTTDGLKNHGDLAPGDFVYHPSGQPVEVLHSHPPVDDEMLRVEFFDGTHIDCHPNHEWTLYHRNKKKYVTVEARSLLGEYDRALYQLPHREALQAPDADLPLDPYTLGAWLGDGTSSQSIICGREDDLAHIRSFIPYERGASWKHKTTGVEYQYFRGGMVGDLRTIGVLNNKHIPVAYLTASESQRRDLLAGLVDTDGHWSEPGKQFVFVSASLRLAEDVRTLVRSLGYRAGLVEREDKRTGRAIQATRPCYAVTWTTHDGLGGGRLSRKQGGHKAVRRRIGVRSVRPVAPEPMNCITVASEDGLYLVGEQMAPTHNSAIVTETVPAWYLTKFPDRRVIATGYEAEFAKGFGRANRDKIELCPEFDIEVDRSTRAADNWNITKYGGGMVTAGAGGGITGKRMDLLIIDDPIKNQDDALSAAVRKRLKNWWESVVKSRMRTDSVIILIQTRWHEDDLAGHVSKNERCYVLNLPALAFEEYPDPETGIATDPDTGKLDPLGRKPGQALCPALQTRSMLLRKQESGDGGDEPGGMLWFSALYQGKPNIEGGGIIAKPFYYFTNEETFTGKPYYKTTDGSGRTTKAFVEECIYFITSDLAASVRERADWTVFSLFAWTKYGHLLLIDMERMRLESPDHASRAESFWRKSKERAGGAGVRFFGVESKTFGLSLIQTLQREARVPVRPLTADTEKIARAVPIGMMMKEGRLFLPKGAEFLPDLEAELSKFPNAAHDDMVDTLGYAVKVSTELPRPAPKESEVSREEAVTRTGRARRRLHPVAGRMW